MRSPFTFDSFTFNCYSFKNISARSPSTLKWIGMNGIDRGGGSAAVRCRLTLSYNYPLVYWSCRLCHGSIFYIHIHLLILSFIERCLKFAFEIIHSSWRSSQGWTNRWLACLKSSINYHYLSCWLICFSFPLLAEFREIKKYLR